MRFPIRSYEETFHINFHNRSLERLIFVSCPVQMLGRHSSIKQQISQGNVFSFTHKQIKDYVRYREIVNKYKCKKISVNRSSKNFIFVAIENSLLWDFEYLLNSFFWFINWSDLYFASTNRIIRVSTRAYTSYNTINLYLFIV